MCVLQFLPASYIFWWQTANMLRLQLIQRPSGGFQPGVSRNQVLVMEAEMVFTPPRSPDCMIYINHQSYLPRGII